MQPTPYNPAVDFSEEEALAVAGRSSVRTAQLDAELQAIATSINQIRANLAILQRDDELLRDQVVKAHTLDTDVLALIATACTPRGDWATETNYGIGDIVLFSDLAYLSLQAHVSGIFLDDKAAGKWTSLTVLPYADIISSDPGKGASLVAIKDALGLLTGANVEEALAEIITALNTLTADLASASPGKGASLVAIEDALGLLTAANVEEALAEIMTAVNFAQAPTAGSVSYDNSTSGLAATDVQGAVDEVQANKLPSGEFYSTRKSLANQYVREWVTRASAADNNWLSVCWSPELGLFAAVAISGVGNRVMTSR